MQATITIGKKTFTVEGPEKFVDKETGVVYYYSFAALLRAFEEQEEEDAPRCHYCGNNHYYNECGHREY